MLLDLKRFAQVYLVCGRAELHRWIDGLAGIVQEQYDVDPYCQNLYMFYGNKKDCFKALHWDGNGFVMLYKRYENGRFQWPMNQNVAKALTHQQLTWLLMGWSIQSSIHSVNPPRVW